MPKPGTHTDEDVLRQMGYEQRDISLKTLVKWTIFLFFFVGLSSVVALGIYKIFVPEKTPMQESLNVTNRNIPRALPTEPRLQVMPQQDLIRFRATEERLQTTYGKPDSSTVEHGPDAVRIPIDRAIDLIAERGLPATPPVQSGSGAPR